MRHPFLVVCGVAAFLQACGSGGDGSGGQPSSNTGGMAGEGSGGSDADGGTSSGGSDADGGTNSGGSASGGKSSGGSASGGASGGESSGGGDTGGSNSGGTNTGGAGAGDTGGSGGVTQVCEPGSDRYCTCSALSGSETCKVDGSGYDACACDEPVCGNSEVEGGEGCDDGNTTSGDGCEEDCQLPTCGNGIVDQGEDCDDQNNVTTDACIACQDAVCGDGIVWAGHEVCDDGDQVLGNGCDPNCALSQPLCGDGFVQVGEACDDGDFDNDDGCTEQCKLPTCGDGFLQSAIGEACDDGNAINTDSCTESCEPPTCGDGFKQGNEACDDGNADNTDGCTQACKLPVCGDGFKQGSEACDDGDFDNNDGCTEQCKLPVCGDGFVQPTIGETCDDGNATNGDGCNTDCSESGQVINTVTYAGADAGDDKAYGVAIDSGGNVVVVGSSFVTGKGQEIFLWRLSSGLSELKVRTFAGSGNHDDIARGVAIGSGDRIFVTADYYSEITPDDGNKLWYGVFQPLLGQVWTGYVAEDTTAADLSVDANDNMFVTGTIIAGDNTADTWTRRLSYDGAATNTWTTAWTTTIGHKYGGQQNGAWEPSQDILLTNDDTMAYVLNWDQSGNGHNSGNIYKLNAQTGVKLDNPDACCDGWRMNKPNYSSQHLYVTALSLTPGGKLFVSAHYGYGPQAVMYYYPENLITTQTYYYPQWEDVFPNVGSMTTTDVATGGTTEHPVVVGNSVSTHEGIVAKRSATGAGLLWTRKIPGVHIEAAAVGPDNSIYAVGWTDVVGQPSNVWVGRIAP